MPGPSRLFYADAFVLGLGGAQAAGPGEVVSEGGGAAETRAPSAVVILDPETTEEQQDLVLQAIADGEGTITIGLGSCSAVVSNPQSLLDSLCMMAGLS